MRMIGEQFTGPINLASGGTVSIQETAQLIRDVAGGTVDINWDRSKPDGQKLREYDVTKLRALGFREFTPLQQALAETYHWYAENHATARR
jgi:GDP-L-fucose synthase